MTIETPDSQQLNKPEKCSLCQKAYNEDEQWIAGHIGITPIALCELCLTAMIDMVNQIRKDFMVDDNEASE